MSEEDIWDITLRQFNLLVGRYNISIERQYYQSALICAVLCNINRDPKKGKTFSPADFMPTKEAKKQSPQDMLSKIKLWQALFEAKEKRHG